MSLQPATQRRAQRSIQLLLGMQLVLVPEGLDLVVAFALCSSMLNADMFEQRLDDKVIDLADRDDMRVLAILAVLACVLRAAHLGLLLLVGLGAGGRSGRGRAAANAVVTPPTSWKASIAALLVSPAAWCSARRGADLGNRSSDGGEPWLCPN